jgi:hypothetical protein
MKGGKKNITTHGERDVLCPFFRAHGATEIICEGVVPETNSCMRFRDSKGKEWHRKTYCVCKYKKCEQYLSVIHWQWPDD